MQNPKTTIGGYLMILGAVMSIGGKLLAGELPNLQDFVMFVGGISFIMSKDGGH
jgi:hypothetical protein